MCIRDRHPGGGALAAAGLAGHPADATPALRVGKHFGNLLVRARLNDLLLSKRFYPLTSCSCREKTILYYWFSKLHRYFEKIAAYSLFGIQHDRIKH